MTTIKATCPSCGEVDLTADDILLRIGAAQDANTYGFTCPLCGGFVEKPADERVIRLLLSGGVIPMLVHVPAEALEAHTGPPISHDDLLEFHEMLESDDWLAGLTGEATSGDVPA
jgi:rRNA maturation protein Nop10